MKQCNRIATLKEILQIILNQKGMGTFTRNDIDKAIMNTRGMDPRTLENWFNYLWKLEYIRQPDPGVYVLNFCEVSKLDIHVDKSVLPLTINKRMDNV